MRRWRRCTPLKTRCLLHRPAPVHSRRTPDSVPAARCAARRHRRSWRTDALPDRKDRAVRRRHRPSAHRAVRLPVRMTGRGSHRHVRPAARRAQPADARYGSTRRRAARRSAIHRRSTPQSHPDARVPVIRSTPLQVRTAVQRAVPSQQATPRHRQAQAQTHRSAYPAHAPPHRESTHSAQADAPPSTHQTRR
ncbi:hypothetical protein R69776_08203 [Paraburkholderia nemoris]|uniref:Uncharacterized protein n=1 Tax=Paraburkholderia nemoris TaxID=2793076 RepID=A0ABM8T7I6_9BURK|nr:hypothetical protein R75777_08079 [Paraburkholderia nemoris]CAE6864916.1 hypothetical protein R69776_08203 [Paraburkholderia nemoris]